MLRQPDGQDLVERTMDGLAGGAAVCCIVRCRQCVAVEGQAAADCGGNGQECGPIVHIPGGECAYQGQEDIQPVGCSWRRPRCWRRIWPARAGGLLCSQFAGTGASGLECAVEATGEFCLNKTGRHRGRPCRGWKQAFMACSSGTKSQGYCHCPWVCHLRHSSHSAQSSCTGWTDGSGLSIPCRSRTSSRG